MNKALNKVRAMEVSENESLLKTKYLWLSNKENLTIANQEKLKKIREEKANRCLCGAEIDKKAKELYKTDKKQALNLVTRRFHYLLVFLFLLLSMVLEPLNFSLS